MTSPNNVRVSVSRLPNKNEIRKLEQRFILITLWMPMTRNLMLNRLDCVCNVRVIIFVICNIYPAVGLGTSQHWISSIKYRVFLLDVCGTMQLYINTKQPGQDSKQVGWGAQATVYLFKQRVQQCKRFFTSKSMILFQSRH